LTSDSVSGRISRQQTTGDRDPTIGDGLIFFEKGNDMTNFDLQKPSYVPDDLDEATTKGGSSIEIEVVDEGSLLLGHIRGANEGCDGGRWMEAADYVGYEPYEPNPYHGTYSEM
jgi:hypothetical protein